MALEDNLELAINFNSNVLDKSGNGRNGIVNGMTYETGSPIIGSGSGTFLANDYLDLDHNYQSVFQASYTIAIWVKPDDGQPAATGDIFGLIDGGNRVRITLNTLGDLIFQYIINGGQSYICNTAQGGYNLTDGAQTKKLLWVEADTSANVMRFYVDNDLKFTKTGVTEDFTNYGGTLSPFVGAVHKVSPVASSYYNGDTDALAIWSAIKSSTDRDAYWNGGNGVEIDLTEVAGYQNLLLIGVG